MTQDPTGSSVLVLTRFQNKSLWEELLHINMDIRTILKGYIYINAYIYVCI